jgi:cytochrome c oxidase assembly factor CtaG
MNSVLEAFLRSWPFDPWLFAALCLTAAIYLRGWLALRRRNPQRWPLGKLVAFFGGLVAIDLALASPIEPFAALLLQVHMLQHLLLMMVAPPLLWLAAPLFPVLRGLPQAARRHWVAPLFRSAAIRWLIGRLTHPAIALPLFIAATWLWHTPALYGLALQSSEWHYVQHACFLGTGLLFWYPVIRPYPSRPRWSAWLLGPYLIVADAQNTLLSALLTFSSHVWFPYYLSVPRLSGISVLADQAAAGALMWVFGSLAFLLPLFVIGIRLLYGQDRSVTNQFNRATNDGVVDEAASISTLPRKSPITLPVLYPPSRGHPSRPRGFNLLDIPLLGTFLKWRHARLALQFPMAVLAGVLILDGLRGPQIGAMNLAGVLPWIHWRGLLILTLLVAGNFFCMACPFMLPRTLARRWLPAGRNWPRWLRSKWLAAGLLVLFLWAYEAFSLWDSPRWTAWLAIGYFALAFAVDGFFRGAAFCKYVCPIGQFNFVQSLVSPLEVKVVDHEVCSTCRTKDCIRGRDGIPGCELRLFQPRKVGNMDCTFCLDCIHACPHENVGILARMPSADLLPDAPRSGVGRFSNRPDLAVLIVVLVFGAFANAAGMVGPVVAWHERLDELLGQASPLLVTSLFYAVALLLLPAVVVGIAAILSRHWGQLAASRIEVATRFAYALVPLGFGMWLAHYSFHFLTSCDTIVPTATRFLNDLGLTMVEPTWVADCCRPMVEYPLRLEILFLDFGLLMSLYTGYRIAQRESPSWSQALRAFAPWALLIGLLFVAGIWLVCQQMQMRGTLTT